MQGALVAIDVKTGAVRAMVGGSDFERTKFNRATQAMRQVGSAFKPFVYAAAIERAGYTPATIIDDSPISFPDIGGGAWSPHNFDYAFWGPIPMRRALEQSRNIPAVKTLEAVGIKTGIEYAHKLGLSGDLPPYLPLALGAGEATLTEMASAYAAFANQGLRMKPYLITRITDRDGNIIEEGRPAAKDAIRADTAYIMTSLLRGVVQRGTAARASSLKRPIAGKTGTTNDFTDAWFIGFEPSLSAGRLGRLRRQAQEPRPPRGGIEGRPAHLDGLLGGDHEGQAGGGLRRPRQHRLRARRPRRLRRDARRPRRAHGAVHRRDRAPRRSPVFRRPGALMGGGARR